MKIATNAAALALAALVLTGCGTATATDHSPAADPPVTSTPVDPSAPDPATPDRDFGIPTVTLHDNTLRVVTYGSSSCPATITSVTAASSDTIHIDATTDEKGPCTADYGPHSQTVNVPAGADLDRLDTATLTLDGNTSTVRIDRADESKLIQPPQTVQFPIRSTDR